MKTRIKFCLACLLFTKLTYGQTAEPAQAQATYHFIHIRDTTDRAHPYTENLLLLLGRNTSACTSIDARLQQENFVKQVLDQAKTAPVYRSADLRLHMEKMKQLIADRAKTGTTSMLNMTGVGGPRGSSTAFYQFQAEKKLIRQEKIINLYLLEEPLPVINWKITADTASFGSLQCQKATTTFKGRNYEAWFCPTLPFHSGPWKLNGLPGLIVEASDSKKEVIFKFAGLEDVSKIVEKPVSVADADKGSSSKRAGLLGFGAENFSFKTIELPQDGLKTTEKDFARLKEAMKKDPQGFTNAAFAASGSSARVYLTLPSNWGRNTINNPIELSEKT